MTWDPAYAGRLAALALRHPIEFYDRVKNRRQERSPQGEPPELDAVSVAPRTIAHDLVGASGATCCGEVEEVRAALMSRMGPTTHHHDGGTVLGEILWVLVRHHRPESVIETGVARGISSAFILDALTRNGRGHLWSIDLPPLTPEWQGQTGIAVAEATRSRWTYLRGTSARRLQPLLDRVGAVDLFLHDGLHTTANVLFEMRSVWPHLTPGGFLVVDDADDNHAVPMFAEEHHISATLVREDGKEDVVAVLGKAPDARLTPIGHGHGGR